MPAYIYGNGSEKVFMITLRGGPGGRGLGMRASNAMMDIEKAFAVVYYDQRGSGMSQGSYSEDELNIDVMAEDVLALVDVLQAKYGNESRFFLWGASWGGTLGTAALLKDQSKFKGWIEAAGAHDPKAIYQEYPAHFRSVAAEQIALGNSISYWEKMEPFLEDLNPEIYSTSNFSALNSKGFEAERRLVADGIINERVENDYQADSRYDLLTQTFNTIKIGSILIRDQELFNTISYTSRLSEITIPTLLINGRNEMVTPLKFAQEAFENIGSSEKKLVILEKSGHHTLLYAESDLFAREIIDFINQNK